MVEVLPRCTQLHLFFFFFFFLRLTRSSLLVIKVLVGTHFRGCCISTLILVSFFFFVYTFGILKDDFDAAALKEKV